MPFVGTIRVPSDKSISHRAVLFAGLAQGVSRLEAVLPSDDVHATIEAMKMLGAHVNLVPGSHGLEGEVEGIGKTGTNGQVICPSLSSAAGLVIDCGNSGTTARLLMGVLAGLGVDATLIGDASLSRRPMERVMRPLCRLGAAFESDEGHLPVRVLSNQGLHAAQLMTEQASAQVKSAILLAGMRAQGMTSVTEPSKSRDHTELLLPAFGVDVEVNGLTTSVKGPVHMHAHDMSVPGDPSSAAFVAVAAALCPGSDVTLEQIALNPTRTGAFEVLRRMGAVLAYLNDHTEGRERVGNVHVAYTPQLAATRVLPNEIPTLIDEIPILAIAAALACGETVFESCGELRVKECDRMTAIIEGLAVFGVTAFADGDDLHIMGLAGDLSGMPPHVSLPTYGDHRLAMTWHLAAELFGVDVELDDVECVCVSWPDFFTDMESLKH